MMLFRAYKGVKDGFDIQRIIALDIEDAKELDITVGEHKFYIFIRSTGKNASCYEELSGLLTARNSIYIDHSKDDFLDVLLPEFKKPLIYQKRFNRPQKININVRIV